MTDAPGATEQVRGEDEQQAEPAAAAGESARDGIRGTVPGEGAAQGQAESEDAGDETDVVNARRAERDGAVEEGGRGGGASSRRDWATGWARRSVIGPLSWPGTPGLEHRCKFARTPITPSQRG